ncbi:MSMEG_0565 family glycosyltransferase [Pseudonocardia sp.]|uniref:MSMEG_0565 family glycosyltransferase n=1 Tax=Pseudonocardia sp. TaxID=60912 RepID=UPI003D0DC691
MRTDRVALLTYSTKPRGGVVHTLALAEALAARGVDVTVWSLGRGGDTGFFRPVDPAVTVRVVALPEIEGETVGERVLRSIAVLGGAFEGGYDIVHAQDCISANAVRVDVRTVHHLDRFTTPQLARCHERAIVDPPAHVCVSDAVATELRDGWGIGATVIPNGVHAQRFAVAVPARRAAPYVLTVGGIEPRKGSLELLEAFAAMRTPGVELVVAGGETVFDHREYRAVWERRAVELGVRPVLLGTVADAELPSLVAGAGVFAFPSVKEGFGIAAMEALAAGVPLVISDLPVFRETFSGAAVFARGPQALAAALDAALAAPDPRRAAAGRALAARHTWDAAARRHLDFYASL